MRHSSRLIAGLLVGLLTSSAASAHTGIAIGDGLGAGLLHPFVGLDHLLAMVAVGLWAVQLGGRHLLAIPAAFVTAMVAGATLAATGIAVPLIEGVIALSILVLGALVARAPRAAWYWAAPLVGAFGLVHGHAHGAEMPAFAAPWQYFAGFALATASLHALGVGGGVLLGKRAAIVRAAGAAIALAGVWLVATI